MEEKKKLKVMWIMKRGRTGDARVVRNSLMRVGGNAS